MKTVCILGNGQLGRMLRQAGEPLGITVFPVGVDADPSQIPWQHAVIGAEIERWPDTAITRALARQSHFINRDIFPLLADRLTQKQLLTELNLATAPWLPLQTQKEWAGIFQRFGQAVFVKRRAGGYDGRGQWQVTPGVESGLPEDIYNTSIVEQAINFNGELSLVGARTQRGKSLFYPLTHNLHQAGILRASVALPQPNQALQQQAEKMLTTIMHQLNYIGVMAMECFMVGDQLLINELAPRVHNSGHWTQNGASLCQFSLHLRTLLGLPTPQPEVTAPSVMINLIGTPLNSDWLAESLTQLHWYDKEVRPGRKVGHINLNHPKPARLQQALQFLMPLLPEEYHPALKWAHQQLG